LIRSWCTQHTLSFDRTTLPTYVTCAMSRAVRAALHPQTRKFGANLPIVPEWRCRKHGGGMRDLETREPSIWSFKGRIGPSSYWLRSLVVTVAWTVARLLLDLLDRFSSSGNGESAGASALILVATVFLVSTPPSPSSRNGVPLRVHPVHSRSMVKCGDTGKALA